MHDNKSGEKKKTILYKETRNGKMHKIYIHVCSHMGIQKMSHKNKTKCTGFFNVKHFADVCDAVLHMTNNFLFSILILGHA